MLGHESRPRPVRGLTFVGIVLACVVGTLLPPAWADEPQSVYDAQWALQTANTDKLWDISRGSGVTVAVVDSGVHASHPDLRGRVVAGGDFGDGGTVDGTHDIGGERGHGTEVASLIAGTGRNYRAHGLVGLAPEARILSFGAYKDHTPEPAAVARSVRAAVAKGAGVLVIPAVGADEGVTSAVQLAISHDVVVVAGAGQVTGSTAAGTAALPGVLTVAALDRAGQVWPAEGTEQTATLGAPGAEILAASSDGLYWTGSGNDLAASWVAGVVALVRSAHPDWSAAQTIEKVIGTAWDGRGCRQACEYGVLDPVRAVTDTSRPTATRNPLLEPTTGRTRVEKESPFAGVPTDRVLLFLGSGLAAMLLYVAGFALVIRKQRGRRAQAGEIEG